MEIKLNIFSLVKILTLFIVVLTIYYYSPCITKNSITKSSNRGGFFTNNDGSDLDSMIATYMKLQDEQMQMLESE